MRLLSWSLSGESERKDPLNFLETGEEEESGENSSLKFLKFFNPKGTKWPVPHNTGLETSNMCNQEGKRHLVPVAGHKPGDVWSG